ncbi:methyltransferase-like protein 22 isoform X2 [Selaginella moellendorffii]|uniref:methyltransferase-like protein 22 isoform X2 n=1 Tax=Selaginella moellendorffii TaxID=88036 RepID=UPI000D1CFE6D|nr:methyltransferase-like protein 22 isoform X2 [Selaginella moellendorffii]|eukprot:XP_024543090.1 methyltransferase-like protein 22 isoform X2 [Selaginella moellendorffii]
MATCPFALAYEMEVLSEVHLECGSGCVVSCFTISSAKSGTLSGLGSSSQICSYADNDKVPSAQGRSSAAHQVDTRSGVDDDGDLIVARRSTAVLVPDRPRESILIYHNMATAIPLVGLQVWRGALLLADFIIHKCKNTSDFENVTALEFGCGTGLAGITLARHAKLVFLTDRGADVLDNCSRNVFANRGSFLRGESGVRVRELDWEEGWPPRTTNMQQAATSSPYLWSQQDLKDVEDATIFLAADVIYSDDLTDAFFRAVSKMLLPGSNKVEPKSYLKALEFLLTPPGAQALYLGLEKRYNFSMDALDVVANGYANFVGHLSVEGENTSAAFLGKRLDDFTVPKYIMEYDRGTDLELWEICAAPQRQ